MKSLEVALKQRDPEIAILLLQAFEDTDDQGQDFAVALHMACLEGYKPVVGLLLEKGAWTQSRCGNAVQAASSGGHKGVVRMLLSSGAAVNLPAEVNGSRPRPTDALQSACAGGYDQVAQMLVEEGAELNHKAGNFGHALQAACAGGHVNLARMLLSHGADVDLQDEKSVYGTALQAACAGGYYAVVQTLLEHGANVNIRGGHHGSALQAAQARGYSNVAQILSSAGASTAEPPFERDCLPILERPAVRQVYEQMHCPGDPCMLKPYCWHDVTANKRYRVKTSQLKLLIRYKEDGHKLQSHNDVPDKIRQRLHRNVSQDL